jgi:hypothetical protein
MPFGFNQEQNIDLNAIKRGAMQEAVSGNTPLDAQNTTVSFCTLIVLTLSTRATCLTLNAHCPRIRANFLPSTKSSTWHLTAFETLLLTTTLYVQGE